jgi:hypothetical protein
VQCPPKIDFTITDRFHDFVKVSLFVEAALFEDGWIVTHDPTTMSRHFAPGRYTAGSSIPSPSKSPATGMSPGWPNSIR